MNEFKELKIAVAGTGYVGLSIATLLSQHHKVMAVDIIQEKVELINNGKSPIQDDYIEKYLAEKELDLTATLDAKEAYTDADFVIIAAPTNVYPKFSVEFSWVKRWCSYHPSNAIYSPINHPEIPSKNLYFRENFGSKFVGDDNLIFHAVCRVTDENEGRREKLSFRESFG